MFWSEYFGKMLYTDSIHIIFSGDGSWDEDEFKDAPLLFARKFFLMFTYDM